MYYNEHAKCKHRNYKCDHTLYDFFCFLKYGNKTGQLLNNSEYYSYTGSDIDFWSTCSFPL